MDDYCAGDLCDVIAGKTNRKLKLKRKKELEEVPKEKKKRNMAEEFLVEEKSKPKKNITKQIPDEKKVKPKKKRDKECFGEKQVEPEEDRVEEFYGEKKVKTPKNIAKGISGKKKNKTKKKVTNEISGEKKVKPKINIPEEFLGEKKFKRKHSIVEKILDETKVKSIDKKRKKSILNNSKVVNTSENKENSTIEEKFNSPIIEKDNSDAININSNESITEDKSEKVVFVESKNNNDEIPLSAKKLKKLLKVKNRKENTPASHDPEAEKRTVFVGNVSIDAKRKDIFKYFQKYGKVETVRIRGIGAEDMTIGKKEAITQHKLHPNRKTVIAYVRYQVESDAEKALQANGQLLCGFHIRVNPALHTSKNEKNSIFIGNLAWDIEEEDLWKKFNECCGGVTNVRVVRSAATGAGKGFAFVTFKTDDAVKLALKSNGASLKGRKMRIKKTFKKEKVHPSKIEIQKSKMNKGLSFLREDKPKHLLDNLRKKEENALKTSQKKNFTGSKSSEITKFRKKKNSSKEVKRKKYISKLLTSNKM